jgi:hypothetical protein
MSPGYEFRVRKEVFYPITIKFRVGYEDLVVMQALINAYPECYESRAQVIRAALRREFKERFGPLRKVLGELWQSA